MLESVPWGDIGVTSGWGIVAAFVWMLFTGRVVTRREADGDRARAEKAEAHVEKLVGTVGELTAVSKLQKAALDAAFTVRDRPESGESP